jgi:hypothetical protein
MREPVTHHVSRIFYPGSWSICGKTFSIAAVRRRWHEIDGAKVNQKLLPLLKNQTQDHCSFCDAFPVDPPSIPTIEHFRPKTAFPREAFKWENLYYR